MTDKKDTFCILPWIHLSTRPNGHVRICCAANASSVGAIDSADKEIGVIKHDDGSPANLTNTKLNDALNNNYMKNIRKKMLNGEVPESCTKCFDEEAAGLFSKRNWETEYWNEFVDSAELKKNTKDDGSIIPELKYVDLRLGSKCNLKCTMCSPHDSSLWISDWKKLYPTIKNESLKSQMGWEPIQNGGRYNWYKNNDSFWNDIYGHLDTIKQLYFAGGEPTIIEEHYQLLDECVKRGVAKNIELRYNSNGIVLPDRLFELWTHFDRVKFHFSIDSIEDMNSYIRYPSEWNTIINNLNQIDNLPSNIDIGIACAVQVLNIYYLPDFIKWKIKQNYKKINAWPSAAGLLEFHLVYLPSHMNIRVLPYEFKLQIKEKYEEFYGWLNNKYEGNDEFLEHSHSIKRMKGLINYMMGEDWSNKWPLFIEFIQKLDNIRGNSFNETFPEMAHLV